MTNIAGATKAQMAPFFSDSQQLRKQEKGQGWKKTSHLAALQVKNAVM